jgi:hypothetical protein
VPRARRDYRRERRENSPPDNPDSQDAARPDAVGKPPARNLKYCIPEKKCAEHVAQLNIRKVKFRGYEFAGDGQVDAIEKRNSAENEQPENQQPPYARRARFRHEASLVLSRSRQ